MRIFDELTRRLQAVERWQQNFRVSGAATFNNQRSGASLSVLPAPPKSVPVDPVTLPHGQYTGMVLQVVGNNSIAFDYTAAVNFP